MTSYIKTINFQNYQWTDIEREKNIFKNLLKNTNCTKFARFRTTSN